MHGAGSCIEAVAAMHLLFTGCVDSSSRMLKEKRSWAQHPGIKQDFTRSDLQDGEVLPRKYTSAFQMHGLLPTLIFC